MKLAVPIIACLLVLSSYAQGKDYYEESPEEEYDIRYGGYFSIGPSLLGAGLVGLDLKAMIVEKFGIETSVSYRPNLIANQQPGGSSSIDFYHAAMFTIGPTVFFKKGFNRSGQKVISNGMFLRGGISAGIFQETMLAIGWARERFKVLRNNNSFALQLGVGFTHLESSKIPLSSYGNIGSTFNPIIFH